MSVTEIHYTPSLVQAVALPRHDFLESLDEASAKPLHVVFAVHVHRGGTHPLTEGFPRLLPRARWGRLHEPCFHPRNGSLVKSDIGNVPRLATRVVACEGAKPALLQRRLRHRHVIRQAMSGAPDTIARTDKRLIDNSAFQALTMGHPPSGLVL